MESRPRPPSVSLACVFIGVTAAFLFFTLTGQLSDWGSIELQKALKPIVADLGDAGVDVTLTGLLSVLRWVGLFYVGVTIAGVVLCIYTMRRDRSARIGLTVVAGLLALAAPGLGALGLIQAGLLVACGVTLWSPDARAWFAPKRPQAAAKAGAAGPEDSAPVRPAPEPEPESERRATSRRPRPVRTAGVLTVAGASFVGGAAALYVLVYALAGDALVTVAQDGSMPSWVSPDEVEGAFRTSFWICVAVLPLAVAGIAAGVALLAGLRVGRTATLLVSWLTVLAGVVTLPLGLIGSAAAVFVIALLNRTESRAWFHQ